MQRSFLLALVLSVVGGVPMINDTSARAESIFCQRLKPCIGSGPSYGRCARAQGFRRGVDGEGMECLRNPEHVPAHYREWERERQARRGGQQRRR